MSSKRPHPNAVATKFGWALSSTGELLVSVRGLPVEVVDYKPNRPLKMSGPVIPPPPPPISNTKNVVEEKTAKEQLPPLPKKRGRTLKTQ